MKKFLITTKLQLDKYKSLNLSLETKWFSLANNIKVELFPISFKDEKKILSKNIKFDGVIFSGGGDLNINKNIMENQIRDKFEIKLLKYCFKNNIKTLLVCRGLQLLASYYNLKLTKKKGHVTKNHLIEIKENIFKIKYKKLNVNSFHHYTFKECPKNYTIVAKHNDGTVEIIFSKKLNSLGFMFHPERYNQDNNKVKKILKNFIYS